MIFGRPSRLPGRNDSVPTGSDARRHPVLWLLSGLGLAAFFLLLGAGSASAEEAPAPDDGLLSTVGRVGSGLTDAVVAPVAPVTDAVRDGVVEPVVQPATEPVVQPLRDEVVTPVREQVLAPVVQPVRTAVAPVVKPVLDAAGPAVAPVREVVRPVVQAVVEPGTSLPSGPTSDSDPTTEPATSPAGAHEPAVVPAQAPAAAPADDTSKAGSQEEADDATTRAATTRAGEGTTTDRTVPTPVVITGTVVQEATASAPGGAERASGGRGDGSPQPPLQPTNGTAAVLGGPSSSSSQSRSGDTPSGAAVLTGTRTVQHLATWSIRMIAPDHALPSSVAHRPGFSPD